jgi:hypothetical protein
MKTEILYDRAAPRASAAFQRAHGSHGHHAPLKPGGMASHASLLSVGRNIHLLI